jgi:hypothetical protein
MVVRVARIMVCCASLLVSEMGYAAGIQDDSDASSPDEQIRTGFRLIVMGACRAEAAKFGGAQVDVTGTCGCAVDSLLESYSIEELAAAKTQKQQAAMLYPIIRECLASSPPAVSE